MLRAFERMLVLALATPSALAQCGPSLIAPEAGFEDTAAWAVSADGSVVAGASMFGPTGEPSAFRWTEAGGFVPLAPLGPASSALGVSANGLVVVGWIETVGLGPQSVAWPPPGGPNDILATSTIVAMHRRDEPGRTGHAEKSKIAAGRAN